MLSREIERSASIYVSIYLVGLCCVMYVLSSNDVMSTDLCGEVEVDTRDCEALRVHCENHYVLPVHACTSTRVRTSQPTSISQQKHTVRVSCAYIGMIM